MANNQARIEIVADDRTRGAFASVQRGLNGMQNSTSALTRALPALGAAFSAASFASFVKSSIDAADEMGKLSQRVGVSVESLSALKYAGDLSDVSLDSLSTSIKKLSVNMADTARGTGEAKDAFGALGINVKDSTGNLKSADQVLLEVADKFSGLEDGAGKTALAVKIFGRAGSDLIPLLNQGSKGLGQMRGEAEKLGLIMSADLAKASEEFNDNLTRLQATSSSVGIAFARDLLPSLNDTANEMLRLQKEGKGLLALLRGFAGLGKLPFDFLIPDNDFTVSGQVKDLREELQRLEDVQAGRRGRLSTDGLLPSGEEGRKRIQVIKNQIENLEKYKDKLRAPAVVQEPKAAAPILDDDSAIKAAKSKAEKIARERQKILEDSQKATELFIKDQQDAINQLNSDIFKDQQDESAKISGLKKEYIDLIDPVEKYRVKLDEIDKLEQAGALSAEQANAARFKINDAIDAQLGFNEVAKETSDIARDIGLTFSSAFEDAIVGGKDVRSVVKALADDLLKLTIRKSLTEPLFEAAQAAFEFARAGSGGGGGGGGFLGGLLGLAGSFFGGGGFPSASTYSLSTSQAFNAGLIGLTNGGVFNGAAGLSAHSGSVVSSPTLFKFASGSGLMGEAGPEAILPLKRGAGGKLGVRLDAGGGGMTVNNYYNIDARGADPGSEDRIRRALRESEERSVSRAVSQVQNLNQRGQLRFS